MSNLNVLCAEALRIATEHGFTDATPLEDLMLMVSELAEACEDIRAGNKLTETWYLKKIAHSAAVSSVEFLANPDGSLNKPCGVPTELADAIIRILHFCGKHGIDLEKAVEEKMAYNESRPFKHGKMI